MLNAFTVGNFLSFKDKVRLDLEANTEDKTLEDSVFENEHGKWLKSAVIYGANASGKTKLINALSYSVNLILKSFSHEMRLYPKFFSLDTEFKNKPSFFEFELMTEEKRYQYGFEIYTSNGRINKEWLYQISSPEDNIVLFIREKNTFSQLNIDMDVKQFINRILDRDVLLLSLLKKSKIEFVLDIHNEIKKWIIINQGSYNLNYNSTLISSLTQRMLDDQDDDVIFETEYSNENEEQIFHSDNIALLLYKNEELLKLVSKIISNLDTHITDLKIKESSAMSLFSDILTKEYHIITVHKRKKGKETELLEFDFTKESTGTQKLIYLLVHFLLIIKNNGVLIIDELETSLHPHIVIILLDLFNSSFNKKAQLIFTTHDTYLLKDKFRTDQINFIEKDGLGASNLFSLFNFELPEGKEINLEAWYYNSKFGATPQINEYPILNNIKTWLEK